MGRIPWRLIGASLAVAGSVASAAVADDMIRLIGGDFEERFGERTAQVSGDIVMGVMLSGDDVARGTADVAVPVLPGEPMAERDFCVRIVSKDGRYEAENSYRIDAGFDGSDAVFPYEGKHADDISGLPAVALVTPDLCGNRSSVMVPAGWSGTGRADPVLKVFLNAAGNPTTAAIGRGETFFEPCDTVAGIAAMKYTAICSFPLSLMPDDGTARLNFFITRSFTEEAFSIDVAIPRGG